MSYMDSITIKMLLKAFKSNEYTGFDGKGYSNKMGISS